ncbi:hypothetical protein SDC9_165340 [bioreactor metagenome]|uniref:Uncharacterized protein n=1 Tax=bioreactor metagenome TaxID=1076179 RepID=A0A645FWB7_9ZZZZ
MNVTSVPSQTLLVDAEIDTEGVSEGLIVIVILLDVAVEADAQLSVEVMTHVITSPF